MTTDRRRPPTIQLELPLTPPPTQATQPLDEDWRLDERTRRIGRQGVAAARALLADTTVGLEERVADRQEVAACRDRGRAGRAA